MDGQDSGRAYRHKLIPRCLGEIIPEICNHFQCCDTESCLDLQHVLTHFTSQKNSMSSSSVYTWNFSCHYHQIDFQTGIIKRVE